MGNYNKRLHISSFPTTFLLDMFLLTTYTKICKSYDYKWIDVYPQNFLVDMDLLVSWQLLLVLPVAATSSAHEFIAIDGSSLTRSFSSVGSVSKLHCTYLCVRYDACSGVSHNTLTNECRLSYVSIHVVDAHVQTDDNSVVLVKKSERIIFTF